MVPEKVTLIPMLRRHQAAPISRACGLWRTTSPVFNEPSSGFKCRQEEP